MVNKIKTASAKKPAVKSFDKAQDKKIVKKKTVSKKEADKFAVIETGGKQYLVSEGETLKIEKIKKPAKKDEVIFDKILLIIDKKDVKIGTPYVSGVKVTAKIKGEIRAKKITVLRYKSKTRYSKKKGHRQIHTKITITSIK